MPSALATRDYQRAQVGLRALVYQDVALAWPLLDPQALDRSFSMFAAAMVSIVRTRRATSAALAKQYLAALRVGVPGEQPVVESPQVSQEVLLAVLHITSVVSVKSAISRGDTLGSALRNSLVRTMGAVDKFVGDGGRELIRASVEADPYAKGWVRRTLGTCSYCAKLAAQEKVQSGSANFPRHDHCGCQPEPAYDVPALQPEEEYVQKIEGMLDADKTNKTEKQLRAMLVDPNTKPLTRANIEEAFRRIAERKAAAVAVRARNVAIRAQPGSVASRVDFPDDALEALLPKRGGWNTGTRAKTIAELKKTPEGRRLLKTMDSFQSGGSTAIPRLRTDIEKYLAGDIADMAQGRIDSIETFLAAVGRSDAGDRVLFRGMSIPGDMEDVASRYVVGDDLDLSLASFSTDKKLAQNFSLEGAGKKVRTKTKTPVMVEWVGEGKRALPIENLSKSGIFAKEKEWVGAGRYVIENVKRAKRGGVDTLVLTIRQVGAW